MNCIQRLLDKQRGRRKILKYETIEIDPEMTGIIELADKSIKMTVVNLGLRYINIMRNEIEDIGIE